MTEQHKILIVFNLICPPDTERRFTPSTSLADHMVLSLMHLLEPSRNIMDLPKWVLL